LSKKIQKIAKNKEKVLVLDDKDRKILSALSGNSRMSIADIERKTGMKRDSIAYRLEKMESNGAVNFSLSINYKKTGFESLSLVFITLQNFNEEREKQLEDYLEKNPCVSYHAVLSGKSDFMIKVVNKSQEEFNIFIRELRAKFSGIIRDIEISSIAEEHKHERI